MDERTFLCGVADKLGWTSGGVGLLASIPIFVSLSHDEAAERCQW